MMKENKGKKLEYGVTSCYVYSHTYTIFMNIIDVRLMGITSSVLFFSFLDMRKKNKKKKKKNH